MGEEDGRCNGPSLLCPAVVAVDLGVERQFGQQEPCHGSRHASVVFAEDVALLGGEQWDGFLQFVGDEAEHDRPVRQCQLGCRHIGGRHQRHASEEVHQVEIEEGTHAAQFSHVVVEHLVGVGHLVHLHLLQIVVAEHHRAKEILPHVGERGRAGRPRVEVERLPEAAVVPVAASCGHDGLVGSQRVEVEHSPTRSLQSLRVLVSTYIIIDGQHGIVAQVGQAVVCIFGRQRALRSFVEEGVARVACHHDAD